MDLKDFVSQTLCQIVEGVQAAQSQIEANGAVINPSFLGDYKEVAKHGGGLMTNAGGYAQVVEFDVALTVTEGTGTKGGIGVFAGAITLGSSGQSSSESTSVSRIKFRVPLTMSRASN
jgi:hypothetical protein